MKKVCLTGGSKGLGLCIKEELEHIYEPGFGGHSERKYAVEDFSRSTGYDLTKTVPAVICDILICNAGCWNNDWKLNYETPRAMAEQVDKNTLVIFVLSNAAYNSFGNDDYTAAKSGLLHYARRKQKEGYRFCTISPGTINTSFWKNSAVDNRLKGCLMPEVVADSVVHIIQQAERGCLIRELIITPEIK